MDAFSAYIKTIADKSGQPLTNKDFNNERIQQARQAVFNKLFEINNIPGYTQKIQSYNSRPGIKDRDKINLANNAVGYGNYPVNSDLPNILGRFYFTKDSKGNILVDDVYNFDHNTNYGDPRQFFAIIGRKFGTPYNIKLNLGNPNTWGNMKYSGNNQINLGWN